MTESTENPPPQSARLWLALLRLASLVALVTSAMLLVDYTSPEPAYCGGASGCAAVRASGYGYLGGVLPVPVLGLIGFGVLYLLTLVPQRRARTLLFAYSVPIALSALAFLALQLFVIGHLCLFCVTADVAGLLTFVASFALRRVESGQGVTPELRPRYRHVLLVALAIGAPLLYPHLRPTSPLPRVLRTYYVAGKLNVVEFADFECPYCRRLHPLLSELIAARGDEVNFVRLNHPLPFHRGADGAARAYLCAEAEGHGESMANRLFEAESLAPAKLLEMAQAEGLPLTPFGECLTSEATTERLERESALFTEVGLRGLPSTYIGDELVVGAQPREALEQVFERASTGTRRASVGPLAFSSLSLTLGLALWLVPGRRRRA